MVLIGKLLVFAFALTLIEPSSAAILMPRARTVKRVVRDTAKTKNIMVQLPHHPSSSSSSRDVLYSLDEMEDHLRDVGSQMGMYISHITVLGRKRYPGNRHWHLKQSPNEPGCLDVTYWPSGHLLWVSIRNCEPPWVHSAGRDLQERMEKAIGEG